MWVLRVVVQIVEQESTPNRRDKRNASISALSPSPVVDEDDFESSPKFYKTSPYFRKGGNSIQFAAGFKCKACSHKTCQRGSFVGYCFIHKRMVDLNETCELNSRDTYKSVNHYQVRRYNTPIPAIETE